MDQKKISSFEELKIIEEKYDPQLSFRNIGPKLEIFITIILVTMSLYHFWASGFGLVREVLHRGIHISYVLALVFLVFGWNKIIIKIIIKIFFTYKIFLLQIIYLLF